MAGFGTVIKNGIMYILLSAPFMYLGAILIVLSQRYLFLSDAASSTDAADDLASNAGIYLFLGLLSIFGGGGLMYLKAVSDTVEEGVLY